MESTPEGLFGRFGCGGRHAKRTGLLKRVGFVAALALITPIVFSTSGDTRPAAANASCANLSLINGNFEATLPDLKPNDNRYWNTYSTDEVQGVGWRTTHPGNRIEFWAGDPLAGEDSPYGAVAFDGNTYVELNADEPSALYQDVATVPGASIVWKLAHRARPDNSADDLNTMVVKIGTPAEITTLGGGTDSLQQGPEITDGTYSWGVYTGIYVVPAGQTLTRFWFESLGGGSYGNFLDGISFMPYNCSSETPTYSPPSIVGTPDGFSFQLTNYDAVGMTASAVVGRATISSTGLVTLTGAPSSTSTTVRVTNHHDGFMDASVDVTANSLGSALVPKFDTPIEITNGFETEVTNFNPDFNWTVATSDSSTATIDRASGVITVTDNPTTATVVRVITTRTSYLSGSAFVKITSVRLPTVVFVPVVLPPSSSYSESAPVQIVPKPVASGRKPVTISIGGFKDGSSVLTSDIKTKIRKFIAKYNDYKVISITGFTEGPTVLKRDRALSRMRAVNALGYVKQGSIAKFDYSNIRASQEKTLGSKIRRIQITLQD